MKLARHSSLGFTPLILLARVCLRRERGSNVGGREESLGRTAENSTWRIFHILFCATLELGEKELRGEGRARADGLPTGLNVTAAGCLRGPLSRYNPVPSPPSRVGGPPSPWNKERCTPSLRGLPPALIF